MLHAVSAGVAHAAVWGARWVLRVRADLLVERFDVPRRVDPRCLYVHLNQVFGPGDNLALGTTSVMRAVFAPVPWSTPANATELKIPERLIIGRAAIVGLDLCQPEFEVWLVKPEGANSTTDQRSKGVRRWWGPEQRFPASATKATRPAARSAHQNMTLARLPKRLQADERERLACGLGQW
eukprot:9027-Prymnesium_polylepis.1